MLFIPIKMLAILWKYLACTHIIYKNLLVNSLFSDLSVIWQVANTISAIYLLTHAVFVLDNPTFSCVLNNLRQYQSILSITCLFLVSSARLGEHFKPNIYLNLRHQWFGRFATFALLLGALILLFSIKGLKCNIFDACHRIDSCYSNYTKHFFFMMLGFIVFFNLIILLKMVRKKYPLKMFILPKILPFFGLLPSDPDVVEIPTISSNVQPSMSEANPSTNHDHVRFSTSFITILFVILTSAIASTMSSYYSNQIITSSFGYVLFFVLLLSYPYTGLLLIKN